MRGGGEHLPNGIKTVLFTQVFRRTRSHHRFFPFAMTELPELRERPTAELLCAGFYPRVHQHQIDPVTWYANYVETYPERDVRQIVN